MRPPVETYTERLCLFKESKILNKQKLMIIARSGRNAASNSPLAVAKRINLSFVRYFTLVFCSK